MHKLKMILRNSKAEKRKAKTAHNINVLLHIKQLLLFIRNMKIKSTFLFISTFLSFLGVLFGALEMGLLIPLLRGIIHRDFSFIRELYVFRDITGAFPELFSAQASLFMLIVFSIFVAAVLHNIFQYTSIVCLNNQTRLATSNIRKIIFNRYLSFGKMFFDRNNIGQLNTMLMGYTGSVASMLKAFQMLISNSFSLIAYTLIILWISWPLTLLTVTIFPAMNYLSTIVIRRMKRMAQSQLQQRRELDKNLFNILFCIPLVKAYAKEREESERFNEVSDREVDLEFKMSMTTQLITPIQNICALVALLILASVLNLFFSSFDAANTASYLVFFFVVRRMVPGFNAINKFSVALAKASATMPIVHDLMESDNEKFIVRDGTKYFEGLRDRIEFRDLHFSYIPDVPVLKGISFTIERGKTTAIVGPTGAGKTTLIHLIQRFYDCPPGTIFIDGTDIRDYAINTLRRHMSPISQDVFLFNDTIGKNIAYGMNGQATEDKLAQIARQSSLYDLIEKLPTRFDTIVGDRGIRLSGGEKQRVSIARALLKGSDIIIMDEATSSLDSRTEKMIQAAIDNAIKGRTAIVIAHRLSTIKHADKIVVIENGRVCEEGTLDELLSAGKHFSEYWNAQKFY